jgi:hypothetical protein
MGDPLAITIGMIVTCTVEDLSGTGREMLCLRLTSGLKTLACSVAEESLLHLVGRDGVQFPGLHLV